MNGPGGAAKDELLERLMVAARAQDEQLRGARRPRRRRRRGLGVVLGVGLGAAAAAGATDLISIGEPVSDPTQRGAIDRPPPGAMDIVAKAPDPAGEATWGIAAYTSSAGWNCVLGGQIRGTSLGLVRDGRFHPYEPGTSGLCIKKTHLPFILDWMTTRGAQPRTVVYGIATDPTRHVVATVGGKTYSARPARAGGFLFVFSGDVPSTELRLDVGAPVR